MRYSLRIAGLGFQLESPVPLELHPHYVPYLDETKDPDVRIRVLSAPPVYPAEQPVYDSGRTVVYPTPLGWFREHRIWSRAERDPGNPCLAPEANGSWILHVPEERLELLAARCQFFWLLAPEARLAERRRLILHAASAVLDGRAYLFFGPSGVGKTTHAHQWAESLGASLLTGDRTVIEWREDGSFLAHGSPFCGSSGICVQGAAPLGGLCLLAQASENRMERLSPARAFRALYAQTTVNSWDAAQTRALCDELTAMIERYPIYQLSCRLGPEGARLCADTLRRESPQRPQCAPHPSLPV